MTVLQVRCSACNRLIGYKRSGHPLAVWCSRKCESGRVITGDAEQRRKIVELYEKGVSDVELGKRFKRTPEAIRMVVYRARQARGSQ